MWSSSLLATEGLSSKERNSSWPLNCSSAVTGDNLALSRSAFQEQSATPAAVPGWVFAVWLGVAPLMVAELNPPPDRQARELIVLYLAASHAVLALWAGVGMIWLGATLSRAEEKIPVNA